MKSNSKKGRGRSTAKPEPVAPPKTAGARITHAITDGSLASAGLRAGDALLGRLIDEDEAGGTVGNLTLCLLDAGETTETVAGYYESVSEEEDPSCTSFRLLTDTNSRLISTGEVIAWYELAQVWRDLDTPIRQFADEAAALAARVVALHNAERNGKGVYLVLEAADAVTTGGSNNIMTRDPGSEFFIPIFVKAVRELGPKDYRVKALKELIARADAGENLAQIYAGDKTARAVRDAAREREEDAKPEPKNRLSDEWRYWKIRQITKGFKGDAPSYTATWREFRAILRDVTSLPITVPDALGVLPRLIFIQQNAEAMEEADRRATVKGKRKGGAK